MRALALGADAAFAGKSFLWAVGALGDEGPDHLIDLYIDELRSSLGQIGAHLLRKRARRRSTIPAPSISDRNRPAKRIVISGQFASRRKAARKRPASKQPWLPARGVRPSS